MNALPFPTNPLVGARYQNWVWNGSRWVCSPGGMIVMTQTFRANAVYTPSPGLVTALAYTLGGGGGGGAAQGADATGVWAGGGGGCGSYSRKTIPAALVLGGVAVTIGEGGTGGVWSGTSAAAGTGGITSFGAFCISNGGAGGVGAGNGGGGQPGNGGAPGVGDLAWRGPSGTAGIIQVFGTPIEYEATGGIGGALFGGAIAASAGTGFEAAGISGDSGSGAGGGGGVINQNGAITSGGTGGSGMCWVDEYCWLAGADGDCGGGQPRGQARVSWPGWRPHDDGYDRFGDS
jgi:hypothetical protein